MPHSTIILLLTIVFAGVLVQSQRRCNPFAEWRCNSDDCIPFNKRCNGQKDCDDGSDETVKECISFRCTNAATQFRCAYGACVDKSAECNGARDCADNSDELTSKCSQGLEQRLRGTCGNAQEYQCGSGECISADSFCDGFADCRDKSDETIENCATNCCSPAGFRCGYGGCVDDAVKCNGISDCADNSDENYLLCGSKRDSPDKPLAMTPPPISNVAIAKRPPSTGGPIHFTPTPTPVPTPAQTPIVLVGALKPGSCPILRIPQNGWIENTAPPHKRLSIGEYVDNFSIVKFRCHDHYNTTGASQSFCNSGTWSKEVSDCEAFCDPRVINTYTLQATYCRLNGRSVPCYEKTRPGTKADVNCQHRYERSGPTLQVVTCSENGIWTPQPQPCTPICGEEAPDGVAYIVGGHEANILKAPWHAVIYLGRGRGLDLICGGTILNERVIASAMHCFWDRQENKPGDASLYRVAVGKSNANYAYLEERPPQHFNISEIHYPIEYADLNNNYESDIAIVILEKYIQFQAHIGPICIPYDVKYNDIIVPDGWIGRVAGFGFTKPSGQISPVLKIVELPAVGHERCRVESGGDQFLTRDKFCAGFVNLNVSVCEGDSGGGLVFPKLENARKKFYLRGIVSTGPNNQGSCDSNKYTTFTNILYHETLVKTYEVENRPS